MTCNIHASPPTYTPPPDIEISSTHSGAPPSYHSSDVPHYTPPRRLAPPPSLAAYTPPRAWPSLAASPQARHYHAVAARRLHSCAAPSQAEVARTARALALRHALAAEEAARRGGGDARLVRGGEETVAALCGMSEGARRAGMGGAARRESGLRKWWRWGRGGE
ncbi:MAG: hypothetical protein M1829_000964 [Trizodia sp. TS-e1964]|nr:MAG: hypothetical protein M1829_000964 [Trizodia sp. TS-e1964]